MATESVAPSPLRTALITAVAMVAFAANSVICRLALGRDAIDAASFTLIRLGAGALVLSLIITLKRRPNPPVQKPRRNWPSAGMLFLYAIGFSFAYRNLSAGTGALILFGLVQLTMLIGAIVGGERPPISEWAGVVLAVAGLVWLVLPGLSAPPLTGAVLMAIAGIAWGVYSLRGRRCSDALRDTAANFVYSVPMAVIASLLFINTAKISASGFALAVLSGAVTSGLGYVVWYAALRGLTPIRAAIVQLSVPVIAGLGGVGLLGEAVTVRLVVAATLVLGGIALAVLSRFKARAIATIPKRS